jgi:Protein of unknown function (DUF3293)
MNVVTDTNMTEGPLASRIARLPDIYMAAEYKWEHDGQWRPIRIGQLAAELDATFSDAASFGMLTASNPGFVARGDAENRDADRLLQQELERLDLRHSPAVAIAHNRTWKAYNWLVIDPDMDAFDALAHRFGQIGTLMWRRNSPVRLRMRAKRPETLAEHPAIDWIGATPSYGSIPGEANRLFTT